MTASAIFSLSSYNPSPSLSLSLSFSLSVSLSLSLSPSGQRAYDHYMQHNEGVCTLYCL